MKKIVIIFGASSGVGEACVRRFNKDGYLVIAAARRLDRLKELAKELGNVLPVECDITVSESVDAVFDLAAKQGLVAVVINTASIYLYGKKLKGISNGEFDKIMRTNAYGAFYVCRRTEELFDNQGFGVLITISSLGGLFHMVHPEKGAYSASKHAQVGLIATADKEFGRKKLRAFVVCPGLIEDTPMVTTYLQEHPEDVGKGITAAFAAEQIWHLATSPSAHRTFVYELSQKGLVETQL